MHKNEKLKKYGMHKQKKKAIHHTTTAFAKARS